MADREAHLVGSLPGATPSAAMTTALELLGPCLRTLPDGETGERRNWIISIIEGLRDHPDLEIRKEGDWSDYDKVPIFKIPWDIGCSVRRLTSGTLTRFAPASPLSNAPGTLRRDRIWSSRRDCGDFDLAMFTLGPVGALRHQRAFTEATLAEIRAVGEITGPETLFQIEVPAELVLFGEGTCGRPTGVGAVVGEVHHDDCAGLAGRHPLRCPPLPRRHQRPRVRHDQRCDTAGVAGQRDSARLARGPAARDPARSLLCCGPAGYDGRGLLCSASPLALPARVRFAAGFAHESQSLGDQLVIRELIETLLEREVAISAACGLGRRTESAGRAVLERTASSARRKG